MGLSSEDKEILLDFVNEGLEGLEKAESILLKIETLQASARESENDLIDALFRIFHSIKGSAGFLGLKLIGELTHLLESLLDKVRKGPFQLTKTTIDLLFETCDELHALFNYLKRNLSEEGYEGNYRKIEERLNETILNSNQERQTANDDRQTPSTELPEAKIEITDDLVDQFIVESTELLDTLESELLKLEKNADDEKALNNAFRALHSLKGNAGFLNFKDIVDVAHQAEFVFDLARSKAFSFSAKQISLILKIIDFFRLAITNLTEGNPPAIPGKLGLIDLLKDMLPEGSHSDTQKLNESQTPARQTQASEKELDNLEKKLARQRLKSKSNEVVRVDVQKLDRLMDLVGEIVIAETMVSQHPAFNQLEIEGLGKAINYLQKNIRELQDLAASMRMVPLNGLFSKMRRLVRDISMKRKKEVELEIRGGENEVDRSVIEHISDPLIHILRNAIDHGIEFPDERKVRGKPLSGHILLSAARVGGEIWIEVQDDGKGLDKEKILKRAKEQKLIPDEHQHLTESEIYSLIFKPGFSTADQVTNISGRGVGMDVVKKNVEKIRGHISIESKEGQGTTIKLKIPLTTAIIDGMLMRVNKTIYAIPILDIRESLRVQSEQVVDLIDGQEVIKVRDEIIPVIRLDQLHHLSNEILPIDQGIVVITQGNERPVGFWVHEVLGQQQLVLKPLPKYLGKLEGVSGCAVLGEGNICLVLDLKTMIRMLQSVKF